MSIHPENYQLFYEVRNMYFEVFQGVHNQWYWRLISGDAQKVAFSSKGYPTKQDILMNIEQIKEITHKALIKELQS